MELQWCGFGSKLFFAACAHVMPLQEFHLVSLAFIAKNATQRHTWLGPRDIVWQTTYGFFEQSKSPDNTHAVLQYQALQWFWVENESWKSTRVAWLKSSCECHLWSKKPRIQGDVLSYPVVVQHFSVFAFILCCIFCPKLLEKSSNFLKNYLCNMYP